MMKKHKICFIYLFSVELLVKIMQLHATKHIAESHYVKYQDKRDNFEIKHF